MAEPVLAPRPKLLQLAGMEWSDEGVILSVRSHGETSAIAEIFARDHGRHLGLVRGGRSRRVRPILQAGNHVDATWRARLADHLGSFGLELRCPYAAMAMQDRDALLGLTSICALARLLPERDPHPNLFEVTQFVLHYLDKPEVWPALLVRWELSLLDELGVGLDLAKCAVTGEVCDLVYVSPKTGRAVSGEAGAPYHDKLLRLPPFLVAGEGVDVDRAEIGQGLRLTGHFLDRHIYGQRGENLPEPRLRLVERLSHTGIN